MTSPTTRDESPQYVSERGRLKVTAPAEDLARLLTAVAPFADAKDQSGTYDSIRIEANDAGVVAITAVSSGIMVSAVVPDAEAISVGAVEITPQTARELAKICRHKVSAGSVDALLVQDEEAVELELLYGLPICAHRTRRPALTWRQAEHRIYEVVTGHIGAADDEAPVFHGAPEMTPGQASALTKAAAATGGTIRIYPAGAQGRFLARIGSTIGVVFVCRSEEEEAVGPVVDGAVGDVDSGDSAPSLRVVGARPIGGLS